MHNFHWTRAIATLLVITCIAVAYSIKQYHNSQYQHLNLTWMLDSQRSLAELREIMADFRKTHPSVPITRKGLIDHGYIYDTSSFAPSRIGVREIVQSHSSAWVRFDQIYIHCAEESAGHDHCSGRQVVGFSLPRLGCCTVVVSYADGLSEDIPCSVLNMIMKKSNSKEEIVKKK